MWRETMHFPCIFGVLCQSTWVLRPIATLLTAPAKFCRRAAPFSAPWVSTTLLRLRPTTRGSCRPSWWSCTTEKKLHWKTVFFCGRKLRNNGSQSIIDSSHRVSVYPCCCKSPVGQWISIWADLVWILIGNVFLWRLFSLGFRVFHDFRRVFFLMCFWCVSVLFWSFAFRFFTSVYPVYIFQRMSFFPLPLRLTSARCFLWTSHGLFSFQDPDPDVFLFSRPCFWMFLGFAYRCGLPAVFWQLLLAQGMHFENLKGKKDVKHSFWPSYLYLCVNIYIYTFIYVRNYI